MIFTCIKGIKKFILLALEERKGYLERCTRLEYGDVMMMTKPSQVSRAFEVGLENLSS